MIIRTSQSQSAKTDPGDFFQSIVFKQEEQRDQEEHKTSQQSSARDDRSQRFHIAGFTFASFGQDRRPAELS